MLSSAEYSKLLRRKKYLNDPAYRAEVLAACKVRRERALQDRLYREIVRLKDAARKKRDCIQRRMDRIADCERDILAFVKRRKVVEAHWKQIQHESTKA